MKKLLLLSFIAMFIFACDSSTDETSSANNDDQNSENSSASAFIKYPFKSGIIEFKNEMMGMTTKMTLYFKGHGETQCIASETEMMGKKINVRNLEKDGYFYTLTIDEKTGFKHKITEEDGGTELNPFAFKEEYLNEVNGKKEGTEKIMDKECQVYSFVQDGATNKIWVWDNLVMKMSAEQSGMQMLIEVVKIEETNNFPDGIFEIPSDFTITEENELDLDAEDFMDENAAG